MFSFFKKRKKQSFTDFSFLQTDFHSHVIPDIDDGAKTIEESHAIVNGLHMLGFDKIITTPHVMAGHYPNSTEKIETAGKTLANSFETNEKINFSYAAEYFVDEEFDKLVEKDDLLLLPNNYILIEVSFVAPSNILERIIFQLKLLGYKPILAHPERYLYWSRKFDTYERLKDLGCLLQLNLMSLIGVYGKEVERNAKKMIDAKLFDFAATDAHNIHHINQLKLGLTKDVFHLLNEYDFKNKTAFKKNILHK